MQLPMQLFLSNVITEVINKVIDVIKAFFK